MEWIQTDSLLPIFVCLAARFYRLVERLQAAGTTL